MAEPSGDSAATAEATAAPEQPAEEVIVVQGAGAAGPRAEGRDKAARKRPRPGREAGAQGRQQEGDAVEGQEKYERGQGVDLKRISDKKLRTQLGHVEDSFADAAASAARAEILLTEEAGSLEAEGMAKTYQFSQRDIARNVDKNSARKVFDLNLSFGPYRLACTRNGKHIAFGGRKGHVAVYFYERARVSGEFHVRETVRDLCFLHDESMLAVAQKNCVYIYDKRGTELHCLRNHPDVYALDFLPYHYLMCSVGRQGVLRYQDTSTGTIVAEHRTRMGPCSVMKHNPYNAVVHLGHASGKVTLWTPNMTEPVAKVLCHRGAVQDVAMSRDGQHMVTAGADRSLKVWDVRMFRELHTYSVPRPASRLDLSQRGMLAVGFGPRVQVWKDALQRKAADPYMNHAANGCGGISDLLFRPYDDALLFGSTRGVGSMVVPGAGEPNFDAFEANPYQTRKQQREATVQGLLDKLQPETIVLDPRSIGGVDAAPKAVLRREKEEAMRAAAEGKPVKEKGTTRGSGAKKARRRARANIITAEKEKLKAKMHEREEARQEAQRQREEKKARKHDALTRFR